jgi:integrase/recombinase XerD
MKTNSLQKIEYPLEPFPWSHVINEFLESADLSKSTINSYRRRLRQWTLWLIDNQINYPTPKDLVFFKKYISIRCSSTLTVCNYLTAIRSLLRWTHRREIYPNITEEVRNPVRPRGHRKDALELPQLQELLNSIETTTLKGKRDFALCRLLAATGPRGIEIHRANIEDIRKEKGKWLLYVQGKGRYEKDEFVVLTQNVLKVIEDYLFFRSYKSKKEPLFTSLSNNYFNQRLSTRSVRGIVKKRLRAIGINTKRISCHSMRHTCITLSLLAGNGLQETKELARHADINTTLLYGHNLKLIFNPAFESIDEMIEGKN